MPSAPLELETHSSASPTGNRLAEERAPRARAPFRAAKRRRYGRVAATGLVVLAVAAAFAIKLRRVPVTVAPVTRGTAVEAAYATGTVEAFDRVVVKAKIAGTVDLKVREGATVKKGDVLAVIDSPTLQHDLDRGRADLLAAEQQAGPRGPQLVALEAQAKAIEADLASAEHDRQRYENLVSSKAVPQIELDHVTDRAATLKAQLEANLAQQRALTIELSTRQSMSSAAVGSLAARLSDAEVRSPLDGVVLTRFIEPGELATQNEPLLKVGTASNLILECAIDEADVGHVSVGQRAAISLYAFGDAIFEGEVFDVAPDADRAKRSYLAKVRFKAPPKGLRSGMTAEVNVILGEHPNALLVPSEAILADGRVRVVSGGEVQLRAPTFGVRDMLRVEVTAGLSEGDRVVVAGGDGLVDGDRVRAIERTAEPTRPRKSASGGLTL